MSLISILFSKPFLRAMVCKLEGVTSGIFNAHAPVSLGGYVGIWGFPKIRGTIMGVSRVRIQ